MTKTIIAINPGTRYWGISIFQGRDLVTFAVKTFADRGSVKHRTKAAKLAFLSLFDKYVPDILVIEKPFCFWSKQSRFLSKITEEIRNSARMQRMKVCEYSPKTVRKVICNDENAKKTDTAKIICSANYYPELEIFQGKRNKENYWGRMFDSIGLGICYLNMNKKH